MISFQVFLKKILKQHQFESIQVNIPPNPCIESCHETGRIL
jgi:hypothetical protein